MTAEQVLDESAGRLVRHRNEARAARGGEALDEQMAGAAAAENAVLNLLGPRLCGSDELAERLCLHLRVDDQHERPGRHHRYRNEVLRRAIRQALEEERVERMGDDVAHEERVAVGRGLRRRLGADDHAAAGTVVDDDRLAKRLAELRRELARAQVRRPAGTIGHDEPHRFARIALRERAGAEGEREEQEEPHASLFLKVERATPARISPIPAK